MGKTPEVAGPRTATLDLDATSGMILEPGFGEPPLLLRPGYAELAEVRVRDSPIGGRKQVPYGKWSQEGET